MAAQLNLLGQFELLSPVDEPVKITSKNGRFVLAMLALSRGNCLSREKLISVLWANRSEQQARNSLRQTLSGLRKTFKLHRLDFFKADYSQISLEKHRIDIDILKIPKNKNGLSADTLESLSKLFKDQFLSDMHAKTDELEQWLDEQRRYFDKQKKRIMQQLIRLYIENTDHKKVIATGNRLLAHDPLDEQTHQMMMQAYVAMGDRVAALKQYRIFYQALDNELSIEPSIKTTHLFETVLNSGQGDQSNDKNHGHSQQHCEIPEKPSIAILPFRNLSPGREQQSLCVGLTEDISSHLSRFRDLFVITGRSSSECTDRKTKFQDIAENLGVDYVLEGSIQNMAKQIRISTKLIEARRGIHLWSEIYDRKIDQVNHLQDDVSEMIVGTLATVYGGRLRKAWQDHNHYKRSVDGRAFDYFMKAINCANAYTGRKNQRARHYFKKAVEIDPGYAKAYCGIACTHLLDAVETWKDDYDASMKSCLQYANLAIECDDSESWSYWQLAVYFIYTLQHDLALAEFEKAIQLNPNDADVLADAGYYFSYCGNSQKGLEYAQKAMRLNPHYPDYYLLQLGQIFFDARQYENAIKIYQKSHRTHTALGKLYLAASHAALGQAHESRKAIDQALTLDENATIEKWTNRRLAPYRHTEDLEHFRRHLKSAGLH